MKYIVVKDQIYQNHMRELKENCRYLGFLPESLTKSRIQTRKLFFSVSVKVR